MPPNLWQILAAAATDAAVKAWPAIADCVDTRRRPLLLLAEEEDELKTVLALTDPKSVVAAVAARLQAMPTWRRRRRGLNRATAERIGRLLPHLAAAVWDELLKAGQVEKPAAAFPPVVPAESAESVLAEILGNPPPAPTPESPELNPTPANSDILTQTPTPESQKLTA